MIATPGISLGALAAKAATTTIPIVFGAGDDPVKLGLVASLARPGGNAPASISSRRVVAKRLGLLHDLVPKARSDRRTGQPGPRRRSRGYVGDAPSGCARWEYRLPSSTPAAAARSRRPSHLGARAAGRLFVAGDALFLSRRVQFATLAARQHSRQSYSRENAEAGGLMSYGTNMPEAVSPGRHLVGRILKGAKPADLPVMQPTKFELVINLQTARALGLEVPPTLLARADEVIE